MNEVGDRAEETAENNLGPASREGWEKYHRQLFSVPGRLREEALTQFINGNLQLRPPRSQGLLTVASSCEAVLLYPCWSHCCHVSWWTCTVCKKRSWVRCWDDFENDILALENDCCRAFCVLQENVKVWVLLKEKKHFLQVWSCNKWSGDLPWTGGRLWSSNSRGREEWESSRQGRDKRKPNSLHVVVLELAL